MSNTYDTSNEPLGSTAVKVLYNNASNLDDAVNSDADTWVDRPPFGRIRRTWRGMENAFNQFLLNSGYQFLGDYDTDGPLTITASNQVFTKDGEYWRPSASLSLPYTTVNNWAVDQPKFVSNGDAVLRQQLADPTGSTRIGVTGYANLQLNLDALAKGQFVTPEQFDAVGDGVADDTSAVQQAVTFAQDNGGFLLLKGKYLCSSTVLQTKRLVVSGLGEFNSQIIYTGTGDAWLATLPYAAAGNTNNGWKWSNFGIVPQVAGSGEHGLHVKLQLANPGVTVSFFADGLFSDLYIGDFGAEGLFLDNSVANVDGFFTSRVQFCSITNGIKGVNLGDSLTFCHSKIFGRLCGMNITGVAGARQMILDDLNITTSGGALALQGVEEPTIRECQLEHPGYLSGYTGVFGAFVLFYNCYKPLMVSNTCNPDNGAATAPTSPGLVATAIALTGNTADAIIDQNDIQKGSVDHIAVASSSVIRTTIGEFNTYYGAVAPIVTDAGTDTRFPTVRGQIPYAATLGAGVVAGQALSVPGARIGQFVDGEYSTGSQGVAIRGWVTSANTVQCRLENDTGGTVSLSGGNLKVKVSS